MQIKLHYALLLATVVFVTALSILGLKKESPEEFVNGTIDMGVVVSDLQRSIDFYTNVVGMTQTGGFSLNKEFGKNSGLTGGTPVDIKVLQLKDEEQAAAFKLMSFGKKASRPRSKLIQDDMGIQYITIAVTSLDPFLERIKKHNVELLGSTPIQLGENRRFVLIQDPDGTFIELIGP